jgi:hypothetical protein
MELDVRNFWTLPTEEQDTIRAAYPCETEEEHQAFLNALFPTSTFTSFEEVDEAYDLSDTGNGGYLNW